MARIDSFFKLMGEQKASDLHLSTNNPPMLRINGELVRVDYPPLRNDELKAMVYEIAPEGKIKVFEETSDITSAIEREKQLKNWHRQWKINLINGRNPEWKDLYSDLIS